MLIADTLPKLKIDLGIPAFSTAYDERLLDYINNAIVEITRQGATITEVQEIEGEEVTVLKDADADLVVNYAAWKWRKRDSGAGMPRMVRYDLNCRVFQEKMQEGN